MWGDGELGLWELGALHQMPVPPIPPHPGWAFRRGIHLPCPFSKRSQGSSTCLIGCEKWNTTVRIQFIIARTWKQPRCPSAEEWIRKLWYIYPMEYYSAIKKNSSESVLMRWMKLEPIIQSEVSQKDKDHYNILTHIYGI